MRNLLLFLFLISGNLFAQKIWTLEECINYASENNLTLKQQNLSVKQTEIELNRNYANLLPSINGFASHSYNYGTSIDRYTNQFANNTVQSDNFYLTGQITLFNGFQNYNSIRKSRLDFMAERLDEEKLKNDISIEITSAFMQILFNKEILTNAQSLVDVTKQQTEKNQILFEAGTISKSVLLSFEAQLALEEAEVVNAENNLEISYIILKQMLDLPFEEPFEIKEPIIEIIPQNLSQESVQEIYKIALSNQPDIKAADVRVKSSNLSLNISRGMRSPMLSLQASIGTGFSGAGQSVARIDTLIYPIGYTIQQPSVVVMGFYPTPVLQDIPFSTQLKDNVNKTAGINLQIPILNAFQVNSAISKNKIALKSAELSKQIVMNNLNKNIQQAYSDAKAALKRFNAAEKSLLASQESYNYAKEKFDAGVINYIDFNDAKNKYAKAQSDLTRAKYDYVYRIKILDFYKGKPLY